MASLNEGILAGFSYAQLLQGLDGNFFTQVQRSIALERIKEAQKVADASRESEPIKINTNGSIPKPRGRPTYASLAAIGMRTHCKTVFLLFSILFIFL